jgi:hypothetical protein
MRHLFSANNRLFPACSRVRRFSVLSETVFAHIFPVSNEIENERRTLESAGFARNFCSVLIETVFEWRTLACRGGGFMIQWLFPIACRNFS